MLRIMVAATLLCALGTALAHDGHRTASVDPNDIEIQNWIQGLKDRNGVGCCSTADGFPADVQWDTQANKYRVFVMGEWRVVPDQALLDVPNKLGHPMVWWFLSEGAPVIRCFLPGAML